MGKHAKCDEDFKRSLVSLYHGGKTQTALIKEYGVSYSTLAKWIKQYSEVTLEDDSIMTAKQIKDLQKRNAQFEEENHILKKPLPSSHPTQTKTKCYSCITISTHD